MTVINFNSPDSLRHSLLTCHPLSFDILTYSFSALARTSSSSSLVVGIIVVALALQFETTTTTISMLRLCLHDLLSIASLLGVSSLSTIMTQSVQLGWWVGGGSRQRYRVEKWRMDAQSTRLRQNQEASSSHSSRAVISYRLQVTLSPGWLAGCLHGDWWVNGWMLL